MTVLNRSIVQLLSICLFLILTGFLAACTTGEMALATPTIQLSDASTTETKSCEYAGYVFDSADENRIRRAKVTVTYKNTPYVGYTDDEGYYNSIFPCAADENPRLRVRIEAEGYEIYEREIILREEVESIYLATLDTGAALPDTPMSTPTPSGTPTSTSISIPVEAEVIIASAVNIRQGPGTNYLVIGSTKQGEHYKVIGKNPTGDWWQIDTNKEQPGDQPGWVFSSLVTPQNTGAVQIALTIPPSPTPAPPMSTPSPTATLLTPTGTSIPTPLSPTDIPQSQQVDKRSLVTFFIGSRNATADNAAVAHPETIAELKTIEVEGRKYEETGNLGCIYAEQLPGTVPLASYQRVRDSNAPEYLTTIMGKEPNGYKTVRIEGYVYEEYRDGTIALYQYYAPSRQDYVLTTSDSFHVRYDYYELKYLVGYILPQS